VSARDEQSARRQKAQASIKPSASGIAQYFSDFVDIVEPWRQLCGDSARLDLVVMYASSWRNTYLKDVKEMLKKPSGRLRAVLPALREPLLKAYSTRLATPSSTLASRIRDAWSEFEGLGDTGHVQLYATTYYMNHALYLFDTGGVLAFYSYRTDRCPTPAVLLGSGDLLEFSRQDFEWLVSRKNPETKLVYDSRHKR
jgi:hypothetical protein